MKKVAFLLSILFVILTFIGAGYVLSNSGKVNAGYAMVPMVFALVSITFYRNNKRLELPIPTHLKNYLIPVKEGNSGFEVTGNIYCACGNDTFEIFESNDRELIKLNCKKCQEEILLFDAGIHGWNGYVCHDDFLDRKLPLKKYNCLKCGKDEFKVMVQVSSQGKEDFMEECVSNDDSFSAEEWVNGFEWFTVSLYCAKCNETEKNWADVETM